MRTGLILGGVVVIVIGGSLTLTVIGLVIGIPFMLLGTIMILWGVFSSGKKVEKIYVSTPVGKPYSTIKSLQPSSTTIIQKQTPPQQTVVQSQTPPSEVSIRQFCNYCGAPNPIDAGFCKKCGKALPKR